MQWRIVGLAALLICVVCHGIEESGRLQDFDIVETERHIDATESAPAGCEFTIEIFNFNHLEPGPGGHMIIEEYTCLNDDDVQKMRYMLNEYKKIAKISKKQRLVYLRRFEIFEENQGIGKQLFLYSLVRVQKRNPDSIYFWIAEPLNGDEHKERLFQFYKNCGATMLKNYGKNALFYIDVAQLDLGFLKPKKELKEFLNIRSR